jgi:hypothetical protein
MQLPFVPKAQVLMWSMAALAAEAALEKPLALMIFKTIFRKRHKNSPHHLFVGLRE